VVHSMSAVVAVIALAPMLVGLLAAVYLFLRAMRQYRARVIVAGGLVVMAVAMAGAALLPVHAPYWLFIVPLFLFGVGYLVASTIWTSAFLRTAVAQHYGVNAAISSATSTIGLAVGSALTGSLLARLGLELYLERLAAANLTVAEILEAATSLQALMLAEPADVAAISELLRFDLLAGYQEVYAIAYSQVLWLMVVFCLITALIIGFSLRRSLKATLPHEEELSVA
jgi:MFS family permease